MFPLGLATCQMLTASHCGDLRVPRMSPWVGCLRWAFSSHPWPVGVVFAGVALVLSLAGIAGVIAFGVRQRTHEIGIRMALGAQRETVMRSILRRGMVMVVMGLGLGAVGSMGLVRLISGLLRGVPALDPLTFILTGVLLGAMGMAACYVPGRQGDAYRSRGRVPLILSG